MKLFWQYGRTFAALLLVSLFLLIGQAACDLTLPSLMGEIAQNGMAGGEPAPGAPEALSLQGMTLLRCFMTADGERRMSETYLTFEPESSEARRLSERYPGAREQAICALREGLSEEQLTAAQTVYEKAAYALLLYLQQERDAGNLEDLVQTPPKTETGEKDPGEFRDNLRDDLTKPASSLPEGVLGTVPDGALFRLPESSVPEEAGEGIAGGMQDSQEQTFGSGSAEEIAEKEAKANTRPIGVGDIDGMDIELVYTLLPRLARTKESVIAELISTAEQGNGAEIRQTGSAFKRLFYREIGMSAEQMQAENGQNRGVTLLGIALLGLLCGVLAILLLSRIVTLMGERLQQDLEHRGEEISQTIEELKRGLPLTLCALCTVPVWLVGSTVLLLVQNVAAGWRIAVALVIAAGLLLSVTKVLKKPLSKGAERLFRGGKGPKRMGWLFPLSVTLVTWLMNVLCVPVFFAGGFSPQTGAAAAFVQYTVQAVLSVLAAGVLTAALSQAREREAKL